MIRSKVVGCGGFLPKKRITNSDLSQRVETTDEWIVQRTGIRQRYFADETEPTSALAEGAARKALAHAGLTPDDVDMIVVATTSPDNTFPSTATRVQARLGMTRGFAFDVQAVCSGFVYAMTVADNFIKAGQVKTALVIGAETISRLLDWEDRTTCVLFGDGAGALVLRAEEGKGDLTDRGILSTHLHSDGTGYDFLKTTGGPGTTQTTGHLYMEGKEVFRYAVEHLSEVVHEALDHNKISADEITWLVPHQANNRIIEATAKKLNLSPDRVIVTVDQHANTSAASIPLALSVAVDDGRIKEGQLILLDTMGGGYTWGASLVRW